MPEGRVTLVAVLAAILAAAPALAQTAPTALPVEREIAEKLVELSIRDSRVDVLIDPAAEPVLRVTDLVKGNETAGFALVEPAGNTLRVGQPHGPDDVAPRLSVLVVIGPHHWLHVRGEDNVVTVRSAVAEGSDEDDSETPDGKDKKKAATAGTPRQLVTPVRGQHEIVLETTGGSIDLEGVTRTQVTAFGTQITARQTRGPMDLAVSGGEISMRRHRGPLLVTGERSGVEIRGMEGPAAVRLAGGSLTAYDGAGRLQGVGEEGEFLVQDWTGPIEFSGSLHRIDVLGSGTARETLDVRGEDHDVSIAEFAGAVRASLIGGSLEIRELGGRARLELGAGATARLENIQDAVDIKASSGADCVVTSVGRPLQARIEDARLEARDVRQVRITALRSLVYLEEVAGRVSVTLTDSEAELDLTGTRAVSELSLKGTAEADVVLSEPCAVRGHAETDDALVRQVTLDGCQLVTAESQYRTTFGGRRGGATPTVLTATIADDATLAVRSRP